MTPSRQESESPLPAQAAFRVLDSMVEGVNIADENGTIVYTNPAEDAMFGYEPRELIGQRLTVLNAYPPEENERIVAETIEELRVTGVWLGEWHNRRKDGEPFTTRARITTVEINGAPHWVCVHEDITAAVQADKRLKESEEKFRTLVEQASDGIFIARENRYVEVNSAACEMLGYSREELLQRGITDVIPSEDVPRLERVREALAGGEAQTGEWTLIRKDGGKLTAEISAKILADGRWQAIVRDVSERRRSDERLRETNRTLQMLIESSPLPIVTISLDGNITLWNPAAERLFGWTAAEVLGKPLPFIPEDKIAEHRRMRAQDLAGENQSGRIVRRLHKNGSPVDLSVSTAPIRDGDGTVTGILSLYVDVTEQKRAQMALMESEERFRLAADTAPVMIWISGADARAVWFNRPWLEFRGRTLEQEHGTGWLEGVHPDDRDECRAAYVESFHERRSFQMEYRIQRADGTYHWVLVSGIPRFSPDDTFLGYIGSGIDINDRKRMEQERESALQELARINEELKQFAYVASHDLQEPLRTIAAYTQLLARKYEHLLDPEAQQHAGFILDAAQRMSALIMGLLDFSRINSGGMETGPIDLRECVGSVLANMTQSLEAAHARVEVDELPHITGNALQIAQLFQNLLSNAVKYRRLERVDIRVAAERRKGEWVFSVSDNGIGIEARYHDRIFGLFKRLHGRELPGTGIGLAICKKIVENHGGRIWLASTMGEGTTFFFTLGQ